MRRAVLVGLGLLCLGAGGVGVLLPLLPTTPFVLLAAACFGRSSERFHAWLRGHPRFGPAVRSWEDHGVVPVRAKVAATVLILASLIALQVLTRAPWYAEAVAVAACVAVLCFLLRRPSVPQEPTSAGAVPQARCETPEGAPTTGRARPEPTQHES